MKRVLPSAKLALKWRQNADRTSRWPVHTRRPPLFTSTSVCESSWTIYFLVYITKMIIKRVITRFHEGIVESPFPERTPYCFERVEVVEDDFGVFDDCLGRQWADSLMGHCPIGTEGARRRRAVRCQHCTFQELKEWNHSVRVIKGKSSKGQDTKGNERWTSGHNRLANIQAMASGEHSIGLKTQPAEP